MERVRTKQEEKERGSVHGQSLANKILAFCQIEGENEDMAEMARGSGNYPTLRGLSGLVRPGQV